MIFCAWAACPPGPLALVLRMSADFRLRPKPAARTSIASCCSWLAPSHLDTWDLKPNAPDTIRGPFKPIKTNVSGVEICEHFPLMAKQADRYALLRLVYHKAAPIHETGHQLMQTGYLRARRPGISALWLGRFPSQRSDKRRLAPVHDSAGSDREHRGKRQPRSIRRLSRRKHEPFFLRGDAVANGLQVADIHAPSGLDPARMKSRKDLLDAIDAAHKAFDATEDIRSRDSAYEQAFGLLFAENAKKAFNVEEEKDTVRNRYGRNTFGQSCMLARRLVEHGVRFVTVNMFDTVFSEITWDCHADGGSLAVNLNDYKETLCPMFDMAYTGLLEDLKQRGMLDNTLVLAMGEFGRTPQLNPRGGRDHHPGVWTILFAGAGVKGGQVIG